MASGVFDLAKCAARKAGLLTLCLLLASGIVLAPWSDAVRSAEAAQGSTLVVALDIGHGTDPSTGTPDPGACANGLREADVNYDIAQACANELATYRNVKVVFTNRYAGDGSIGRRVKSVLDQKPDVVVSIHCNSASADARGSEVWIPNSSAYLYNETHIAGRDLGNAILGKLSSLGLYNRGTKTRDCTDGEYYPSPGGLCDWYGINYWSRWNGIPGIIVEHAFLTNSGDASKLADSSMRQKMGIADAQGIAQYYGLKKKGSTDPALQKTGETVSTPIKGIVKQNDYTVMGTSNATVDGMVAWFNANNATFPADVYTQYGASSIREFCQIVYEEAQAEGVRAELVFAQSMLETGWLKFDGQVKASQCNFAGLGATDNGASGADFSSHGKDGVRMGLRAQVQHLKAYGSTDALKNECVDPRFKYVTRGIAPNVSLFGGKKGDTVVWASDEDYGENLIKLINKLYDSCGGVSSTNAKISLKDTSFASSGSTTTVYVDGVPQTIKSDGSSATIKVSGTGTHSVVAYEYKNAGSSDPHLSYPTSMDTWLVTMDGSTCKATRYYGLDDLLIYAGCSIRVSGTKGIRMVTGVSENVKDALTYNGIAGYTLVETGTLLAWNDRVDKGGLTFDTPGVSRGRAYTSDGSNPVYKTANGVEYYTNVLVGFKTADQYKRDLAMRPYAILSDSAGNQFTVYGGTVVRSIGYIAEQNASAFSAGTDAYRFVHEIIDAYRG